MVKKMNNDLLHDFNKFIKTIQFSNLSDRLSESSQYSLLAGGKRIRPMLLFAALDLFSIEVKKGFHTAAAIEMIHTYSLIHDDLPAMDNDDYRRGLPTNHKRFDEATAILAGDALLTDSFQVLVSDEQLTNNQKVQLIQLIASAAGSNGMVGGQALDMEAENQVVSLDALESIHLHKTGELIRASLVSGGIIAEQNEHTLLNLSELGKIIGLIFQIKDDILDVEGTFEDTGKLIGSDADNNKSTYVTLLGLEGAKNKLDQLETSAYLLLQKLSPEQGKLYELIQYIVERNK